MSFALRTTVKKLKLFQGAINPKSFLRNYPAPVKRFYKNVHVAESDGKFEICLDKRKLKTPLGSLLQLPNEGLAIAVATEWDLQKENIQQHSMHINALCNTAVDNPCKQTPEHIVENMLQYLSSDTICFRSSEPPSFVELQKEKWDPIIQWFVDRYNVRIEVSEDISSEPVPEETLVEMKKQLLSYSYWCLIGINFAAENLKSLILTLAIVNHKMDVEKAVELARLETTFQTQRWGSVEWAHSIDEAQLRTRVAAGVLFTYLNEGSSEVVQKTLSKKASISN